MSPFALRRTRSLRPFTRSSRLARIASVVGALAGVPILVTPSEAAIWPTVAVRIERELSSEDLSVRRRAARQLSELSGAARTRVITHALGDTDVEVRLLASQAGRILPIPGLADRVTPWLTDPDVRVRLSAAETLAEAPSAQAVPALVRALSDAEPSVRRAAAVALAESRDVQATTGLLGRLDDPAAEVREAVVRALAKLGDARAVVPLISKIEDTSPAVRQSVARALGELADVKAVSALVLSLRDAEASVRREAITALGELGDARIVPSIASLLSGEAQASVRRAAVDALAQLPSPAAVSALLTTLGAFPEERERIVRSLGKLGSLALPALTNCVRGGADAVLREACGIALSRAAEASHTPASNQTVGASTSAGGNAVSALRAAFQSSAIGPEVALPALARAGDPEALSTALAFLTDADPGVRRAALEATGMLLNPEHPDGRAVEPLELAFERGRKVRGERLELLRLLGRTGASRASRLLNPIASQADDLAFRVEALGALADLKVREASEVFLRALQDPESRVRLAAALAIRRGAVAGLSGRLLDMLETRASQDREALALALPGALLAESQAPANALPRIRGLLSASQGGERDSWIECLGALPGASAAQALDELSRSPDPADRAKLMESVAARSDARAMIARGARDGEASVRANAVWSAAASFLASDAQVLISALRDEDVNVAANAAGALARFGRRLQLDVRAPLCGALGDPRSAVRANALAGLRWMGSRCPQSPERRLLERDPAARVRQAAATLLRDVPAEPALDGRALRRCLVEEPTAGVALECGRTAVQSSPGKRAVLVFVVPELAAAPIPRATFSLRRPDGLVRNGQCDRRGAVNEFFVSDGAVELSVLAAFEE